MRVLGWHLPFLEPTSMNDLERAREEGRREVLFMRAAFREGVGRHRLPIVILLVVAFLLGFWTAKAVAAEPVTLLVQPRLMLGPSDIRVEARVPRQADNRRLAIA